MKCCRLVSLLMLAWFTALAWPHAPTCQTIRPQSSDPEVTQSACPNGSQELDFYGGQHDHFGASPINVLHKVTVCVEIHNPNPFKMRYRTTFANAATPAQLLLQGPSAAENAALKLFSFPTSALSQAPAPQAVSKALESITQFQTLLEETTKPREAKGRTAPCNDPKVKATEETLVRRLAGAAAAAEALKTSLTSQTDAFSKAQVDIKDALGSIKKAATELLSIENDPGHDAAGSIRNLWNSLNDLKDPTDSYDGLESARAANHAKTTTYLSDLQKTIGDLGTLLDSFNSSNPSLAGCLQYEKQDANQHVGELHALVLSAGAESQVLDEQVAKIEEAYSAWKLNHDAYLQALDWAKDRADQFTTVDVLSGNALPAGKTVTVTVLRRDLAAPSPVPPPKQGTQNQQDSSETTAGTLSFDVLQPSHYGLVVGITLTTLTDPTFASTTRTIPATGATPAQQQVTIFRQTGASRFRPMPTLFFTPYLVPHYDFATKVPKNAPEYVPINRSYIPYPAFGLSLSAINDNYFVGGGEDIARGVALLFGAHFGNVHTLLGQFNGVPIKENTAFTVPSSDNFNLQNVVVNRWHTGFFFSISIDAASLKHMLGG